MAAVTTDEMSRNALLATLNDVDRKHLAPHMLIFDLKSLDISSGPVTRSRIHQFLGEYS